MVLDSWKRDCLSALPPPLNGTFWLEMLSAGKNSGQRGLFLSDKKGCHGGGGECIRLVIVSEEKMLLRNGG